MQECLLNTNTVDMKIDVAKYQCFGIHPSQQLAGDIASVI